MKGSILDAEKLKQEILESHERSRSYGINQSERNFEQANLTPAELEQRKRNNQSFLNLVLARIEEFNDLLSPEDFAVGAVDADGYILHLAGSDRIKAKFAERNCAPGFRWTEKNVGTSAISLCLERQIPVQLNDQDHYCTRAHGFTSSAAPAFQKDGSLLGVVFISGSSDLTHPHTLLMVTSATRSIEKQLRILQNNKELELHVSFLDSVIEAAGMGLMILDQELRIWNVNGRGKKILKRDDLVGMPVSVLGELGLNIEDIRKSPGSWTNRECCLHHQGQAIHFIFTAQPAISKEKDLLGIVLAFEEIHSLRKIADNITGTQARFTFEDLVGKSAGIEKSIELARRAAQGESTALLQGETGTGKELFAQAIHNASPRYRQPFVPLNCGAIPGELLESELFGYTDGAFTGAKKGGCPGKFELASGGTILLDEIGDMPHDMQVKLLRVLQTGEVYRIGARKPVQTDVRIIASTHVDLSKAVSKGRFREDLFYRLNVFPISIPALRERGDDDILALADFFLRRNKISPPKLTPQAKGALTHHHWPGNVRELENTIMRALHMGEKDSIGVSDLGLTAPGNTQGRRTGTLQEVERQVIAETIEQSGSNMAASAKKLGISRATLYRKLKEYNL